MFQTSLDILYLVLAFSVLALTFSLVWLLVEAALALRNVNRVFGEIRKTIGAIERALGGIHDKIEHVAGYLNLIAEGAKQLLKFVNPHRRRGRK